MSDPIPTDITLRRADRVLVVDFDDGQRFELPCEYLRVYSPSAEVKGHGPGQRRTPTGKENVNIRKIEPVGNYAVCLHFDDGHNTGLYSWGTLYHLGEHFDEYWRKYLAELEELGYERKPDD